jgi:hypothetical protein
MTFEEAITKAGKSDRPLSVFLFLKELATFFVEVCQINEKSPNHAQMILPGCTQGRPGRVCRRAQEPSQVLHDHRDR